MKTIVITGGAGFRSAGRLESSIQDTVPCGPRPSDCGPRRSSDINFDKYTLSRKLLIL